MNNKNQPKQGTHLSSEPPFCSPITEKKSAPNAGISERILVVDDESIIVLLLREALEGLPGCQVITATSGEEALELFEQQAFDLLITDYSLSGIDGITLATKIQKLSPQIPIIMLTAYANASLRRRATNIFIRRVIAKPVRLSELRRLALELLSERKKNGPSNPESH